MKKFACILMACLLLAASIAMADTADDTVIAMVNGQPIYREEAADEYAYYVDLYAQYGITDEESLQQLRSDMIDAYVQDAVLSQKVDTLELDLPSDEELMQEAQEAYDETLFEIISLYASQLYTGEGDLDAAVAAFTEFYASQENMTIEEAMAAMEAGDIQDTLMQLLDDVHAYFEIYSYDVNGLFLYNQQLARNQALNEYILADLEITEEDVRAYFDEQAAIEQETYQSDPGQLELSVASGSTPLYIPEGYRNIKHILVLMSDEDQNSMYINNIMLSSALSTIDSLDGVEPMDAAAYEQLTAQRNELDTRISEIDGLLMNEDADIDALTAQREEAEAALAEIDAQLSSDEASLYCAMAQRDDAQACVDAIQAKYQDRLDAIYARLEAGEDFDSLILELGEDPGMTQNGELQPYMVYEASDGVWESNFAAEAAALEEGQYSQLPVWTSYGAHIVYYESAVPAGRVDFETVREIMTEEYTAMRQTEVYTQQVEAWVAEADIETYPDNLK